MMTRRQWLSLVGVGASSLALSGCRPRPALDLPVRLSTNENAVGPSLRALSAVEGIGREAVSRHPADLASDLIAAVTQHENIPAAHIALGPSAPTLLGALLAPGLLPGPVVRSIPLSDTLVFSARRADHDLLDVPLNAGVHPDLSAMLDRLAGSSGIVFIQNPHDPTGWCAEPDALREFASEATQRSHLVIDESYLEYVDNFERRTLVDLVRAGRPATVLRTFSCAHGLAGLRIAYAVTTPPLAARLRAETQTQINAAGAIAAHASLEDRFHLATVRQGTAVARERLLRLLRQLGRRYVEPAANFVFFHAGLPHSAFAARMADEGVIIGPSFSPYDDWARLSIGTPIQMRHAHSALERVLG